MTQQELYLDRGRIVVLNAFLWRQEDGQWHVRIVHRHEGEAGMCPGHAVYNNLTTEETVDVLTGSAAPADGRYFLEGGECHPMIPFGSH